MVDAARGWEAPRAREGASVVVLRLGAVLMVKRARPPYKGFWSFPGGRAQPEEDAAIAARRELLEEAGLEVDGIIPLGSFNPGPVAAPFRLTVFAARAGIGQPVPGDDAERAEFVALERVLTRPSTPGAAGWIARAMLALSDPPLL